MNKCKPRGILFRDAQEHLSTHTKAVGEIWVFFACTMLEVQQHNNDGKSSNGTNGSKVAVNHNTSPITDLQVRVWL